MQRKQSESFHSEAPASLPWLLCAGLNKLIVDWLPKKKKKKKIWLLFLQIKALLLQSGFLISTVTLESSSYDLIRPCEPCYVAPAPLNLLHLCSRRAVGQLPQTDWTICLPLPGHDRPSDSVSQTNSQFVTTRKDFTLARYKCLLILFFSFFAHQQNSRFLLFCEENKKHLLILGRSEYNWRLMHVLNETCC